MGDDFNHWPVGKNIPKWCCVYNGDGESADQFLFHYKKASNLWVMSLTLLEVWLWCVCTCAMSQALFGWLEKFVDRRRKVQRTKPLCCLGALGRNTNIRSFTGKLAWKLFSFFLSVSWCLDVNCTAQLLAFDVYIFQYMFYANIYKKKKKTLVA